MPTLLTVTLAALLCFAVAPCFAEPAARPVPPGTYRNPVGVDIADPDVLLHEGVYYLYGTSAGDGFKVWTSTDLAHWEPRGYAFQRTEESWGRDLFWAPCIVEDDGAFYLFYSARGPVAGGGSSLRLAVARSDSPTGPFTDIAAPLFDPGQSVIDADVLIDEDGRAYLYYVRDVSENPQSEIWAVRLADDMRSVVGEPVLCLKPSQPWEGTKWNEAPFVMRYGDTYVMTYSAQGFYDPRYAVGYATAPGPMGPWTKAGNNPILRRTDRVSGPGHNTIVPSPDGSEWFIVYHVHKNLKGGSPRELAIDRLIIDQRPDGTVRLRVHGPTTEPQPLPSGAE